MATEKTELWANSKLTYGQMRLYAAIRLVLLERGENGKMVQGLPVRPTEDRSGGRRAVNE